MNNLFTWSKIFEAGGPILILLIALFILTVIVVIERSIYYRSLVTPARITMLELTQKFMSTGTTDFSLFRSESPLKYILKECYDSFANQDKSRIDHFFESMYEEIKSRAIAEKIPEFEKYFNILATLGTISPYIGLFGTVIGIIRAFSGIGHGASTGAGMSELNAGIAEALVATAAGLMVAIPSTAFYNYFRKKADALVLEMEVAASRFKILLQQKRDI